MIDSTIKAEVKPEFKFDFTNNNPVKIENNARQVFKNKKDTSYGSKQQK